MNHNYKVSPNTKDCVISIFHLGNISRFKRGITPRKKFRVNMRIYIHIMYFIRRCAEKKNRTDGLID